MMGLMKGMGLDFIGTENPKKKTGLFVLGWFLVVIGLSYGMQISIEKRLCAFRPPQWSAIYLFGRLEIAINRL